MSDRMGTTSATASNQSWLQFAALGLAYFAIGSVAHRFGGARAGVPTAPAGTAAPATNPASSGAAPVVAQTVAKRGLWTIVKDVWARSEKHRLLAVAAGFTFYAILALFPAITAIVSIYGLFANAESIERQLTSLSGLIPGGAVQVIGDEVKRIASQPGGTLGLGFIIGLGTALWSSNSGTKAMFDSLNVAYEVPETRGFFKLNAVSLLFTVLSVVFAFVAIGSAIGVPIALQYAGLDFSWTGTLLSLARWPLMFLAVIVALAVLYRFGVSESARGWQWISPGAVFATIAWVVASIGFSRYAEQFGSFNKTYGTLGAVIGFMIWIWISAILVMFGAELNAYLDASKSGGSPAKT